MSIQKEKAVARRALALVALLTRTQLEHGVQADKARMAGWRRIHRELTGWMKKEQIREALSAAERELLDRPLGEWTNDDIFECVWRSEALTALLWALGMLDWMPAQGKRVDEAVINPYIPALRPVAPWLESAHLRGPDQLRAARRTAEFWLWRARTDLSRRQGKRLSLGDTYEAVVSRAVSAARAEGLVGEPVHGDVDVDGTAFCDLGDAEFANAYSVALHRLCALNWVCGYADNWDETPTDT